MQWWEETVHTLVVMHDWKQQKKLEAAIRDLVRLAVERMHDCKATLREVVAVQETFRGKIVWQGAVRVFDLHEHPSASVAYAWSSPVEGTTRRKFYAVLRLPPVGSPIDAVRASIVGDQKQV